MDWALGMPIGGDNMATISALLDRYGTDHPNHPMTEVLRDGLAEPVRTGRRGGRAARVRD